jgi:hypothetical protein
VAPSAPGMVPADMTKLDSTLAVFPNDVRGQTILADYAKRQLGIDNPTAPQVLMVFPIVIVDAATGDVDTVVTDAFKIVAIYCIKRNGAGAGNTMQIKKGATVISDAIACAVDNAFTQAASIDDAGGVNIFAVGDTLRVTATRAAGTRDCDIFLICSGR